VYRDAVDAMNDKTLCVVFDGTSVQRKVLVPRHSEEYIKLLVGQGYVHIELAGLAALEATNHNGKLLEKYFMMVDDNVALLLESYLYLESVVASGRPGRVWTYLEDGIFEFDALIVNRDLAHVRVGIYRLGDRFKAPYLDGVMVNVQTYLTMWRSVAATIVRVAEGDQPS
jgi:hypothetical protein